MSPRKSRSKSRSKTIGNGLLCGRFLQVTAVVSIVGTALALPGCYYLQAAGGQLEVLRKREPIADVIADPATSPELADRLRLVQQARAFSIRELGLPDNNSYRTFSDLERDYVVWNVFAVPEFSLTPKQWCYPVAGCVAYRGYFKQKAAERQADKLQQAGLDVHLGGVTAYSTLGRFDDPVLSTMMRWDDVQLASVLFHELAHQMLYVKGDSAFNESFATAVEEFGIERFLRERGEQDEFDAWDNSKVLRRALMQLVAVARTDLQATYAADIEDAQKRQQKRQRIAALTAALRVTLQQAGRDPRGWLQAPLNNARIASLSLYEGRLPAFRVMLANCSEELACFYAAARHLTELDKNARDAALDALSPELERGAGR